MHIKLTAGVIIVLLIIVAVFFSFSAANTEQLAQPMENRHVIIETAKGTIELELFEQRVPLTTTNFIDLAEGGFYDGLSFHRVIRGFMIQGGDPSGTGTGGPGYTIPDEIHPDLRHESGTLSMAKTLEPNSGGSQFFITEVATPHLDGVHSVFGRVTSGMDVVLQIQQGDVMDRVLIVQ